VVDILINHIYKGINGIQFFGNIHTQNMFHDPYFSDDELGKKFYSAL